MLLSVANFLHRKSCKLQFTSWIHLSGQKSSMFMALSSVSLRHYWTLMVVVITGTPYHHHQQDEVWTHTNPLLNIIYNYIFNILTTKTNRRKTGIQPHI
jgi:isoprenylcysteine carboxyl methyltransferase (ICMT) family protein YpbQ